MNRFLFLLCLFISFGLISCVQDGMANEDEFLFPDECNTRGSINNCDSVLSFESDKEFEDLIRFLETLPTDQEKSDWVHEIYPNFKSIQDIYWDAMTEMSELEDINEEKYLLFMEKYKCLYFPMYEEDAGYYIPIKNNTLSFLANRDCNVIIEGKLKCLRDIFDYGQLYLTGRAYYSQSSTSSVSELATFNLNSTSMNSVGPEYDSGWEIYDDRKVQLKARRRFETMSFSPVITGSRSLFHLEFYFRKKTLFGWTNYKSESTIEFQIEIPQKGWYGPLVFEHNSNSSHDSEFEYPIRIYSDNSSWYYLYEKVKCIANITYRGVPNVLKYSWDMPGCVCITPITASHVMILPCIE